MKKIFLIVALATSAFLQHSFAQTTTEKEQSVLSLYYSVRNALTLGKADVAAVNATALKRALNGSTAKFLTETAKIALSKDTEAIAASKDLKEQREAFSSLSLNFIAAAKTVKLSTEPVYQLYCPMKNSYWLSSEKAIRNPYYGASMLTCGKVVGAL